jgi:hypothetical protein
MGDDVKYDPTGCENNSLYGLPNNLASVYRRPLPSANVAFLAPGGKGAGVFNIMWDAREPTLESQFLDATTFHGQMTVAPSTDAQQQGVSFQEGLFTAQSFNYLARDLTGSDGSGATGGPIDLYNSRLGVPNPLRATKRARWILPWD